MSDERPCGHPPARSRSGAIDRGQTVLDFAIGMSVFLLAVAFVFAFVPSLLEPFATNKGANTIIAERGAAHLTETSLSAGSAPGVLSTACTVGFFEGEDPSGEACGWTHDADALEEEIGAGEFTSVNVTITRGGEVVSIGRESLAGGDDPPPDASISTASRIVDLNGETHRLTVRVW
ncbi:DUF7287 family protein [Halorubrum vacuolatum]|uniref:Uncharacterized protein n=1 Tax=Halorubrum vacuolatum TaxID=63740 RepID=A0A238WXS0_HALVU|nr:hypothetical protein [Halorubrum vacuolatum]SNR51141.1 hypothetical protein SAMN06264855_11115 [Halorubrum vacuolatum]